MNFVKIVFSPTGGTRKAADAIAADWGPAREFDLSDPRAGFESAALAPDDAVLIAMPSFGGLAPRVALDRLGKIRGGSAKCAVAAVYGNRAYEDTLAQMADAARKSGFRVVAGVSAVAEHSIVRRYAAGRPNGDDAKRLAGFGTRILEKIQSGAADEPRLPGNAAREKGGAPPPAPSANASCSACGLCAERCPVSAIDPRSPRATDGKKCIRCMRCVAICPRKARSMNRLLVFLVALALKKACSVPKENELFI